jgi:hypothetical protein
MSCVLAASHALLIALACSIVGVACCGGTTRSQCDPVPPCQCCPPPAVGPAPTRESDVGGGALNPPQGYPSFVDVAGLFSGYPDRSLVAFLWFRHNGVLLKVLDADGSIHDWVHGEIDATSTKVRFTRPGLRTSFDVKLTWRDEGHVLASGLIGDVDVLLTRVHKIAPQVLIGAE